MYLSSHSRRVVSPTDWLIGSQQAAYNGIFRLSEHSYPSQADLAADEWRFLGPFYIRARLSLDTTHIQSSFNG